MWPAAAAVGVCVCWGAGGCMCVCVSGRLEFPCTLFGQTESGAQRD